MVRSASVSLSATGPAPRSNKQGMWLRSLALSVCLGQLVLPVHHAHALQTAGSGRRVRLGHLHQRARRQYSQSPAIRMLADGEGASPSKDLAETPGAPPRDMPSTNTRRCVLMRHGESEFNTANIFTGWCDVSLTARGRVEASEAGEVFASNNIQFSVCFTSVLTRALSTAYRSLESANALYTETRSSYKLNERHYGALQGLNKEGMATRLGRERVMQWRRSFEARPPPMTEEHPHWPLIEGDKRYDGIDCPKGESLEDTQKRVVEYWNSDILPEICRDDGDPNDCVLVVAHANTLRALVMHLDNISAAEIEDVNVPTAIPFYYEIDKDTGAALRGVGGTGKAGDSAAFTGQYLYDERKKVNFLERRRAASDPWGWALRDDAVKKEMLIPESEEGDGTESNYDALAEAKRNTAKYGKPFYLHDG